MHRIIVTGGAGFIGSHVVEHLVFSGHRNEVHVYDAHFPPAINWDYAETLIGKKNMHLGDVRNHTEFDSLLRLVRPHCVLHLAAQSHVDVSLWSPADTMEMNGVGTQVVALSCAERGIPLVYVSTDEVYGDLHGTKWEADGAVAGATPLNPSSPYSAGKAAGEMAVNAAVRSFGLRAAILRGCNAYGPRQYGEKLIPIACTKLKRGEQVPLHDNGTQVRQWVAADEFASRIVDSAMGLIDGPGGRPVSHVAGPARCTVKELVMALSRTLHGEESVSTCTRTGGARPGQDRVYGLAGINCTKNILHPLELESLLGHYGADGKVSIASFVPEG